MMTHLPAQCASIAYHWQWYHLQRHMKGVVPSSSASAMGGRGMDYALSVVDAPMLARLIHHVHVVKAISGTCVA